MACKAVAHIDLGEPRSDDLDNLIQAPADVIAHQPGGAIRVPLLERMNDLQVLVLGARAAAALHVDPADEMDSRVDASDGAKKLVIVGGAGNAFVKLLVQFQELGCKHVVLLVLAGQNEFLERLQLLSRGPLAGNQYRRLLDSAAKFVKVEHLVGVKGTGKEA